MLICLQKINFITQFFLEINSKLVILGNLGIPGHTYLNWYQFIETFNVYLQAKNQLHPSRFPWDIARILQTCYFGYLGHAWLRTPRVTLSTCRKLSCFSAGKKSYSSSTFFSKIAKICKLIIFGISCMPGYAHPNDSINLQKTSMFICMPKINFIIHFFLEILHFKESWNLIGQQHFSP